MQLITKFILFIVSSLCLFFLIFFTFIAPSSNNTISIDYESTQTGTYLISWDNNSYNISLLENQDLSHSWSLKIRNLSLWNNIYFKKGTIEEKWSDEIHLWEWIYYFDINSLNFNKNIFIEWAQVTTHWPWDFIINTDHSIQKSIYSLSSKIELNLFQSIDNPTEWTLLDIYPNMFVMYNPTLNKQIINADLLRVQNVQYLNMINSPIYNNIVDDQWIISHELHKDIKTYLFFNNENNFNFIQEVFTFKEYKHNLYSQQFSLLSKNDFYSFPGEKYINQYYSYFQNKEKKKIYYKNIILRELISIINSSSSNDTEKINSILKNLKILEEQYPLEYVTILETINYYYENILYSQESSASLILKFSQLNKKINNDTSELRYSSLLLLRNIYTNYHNNDIETFHENLNIFIDQHRTEMDISIYDDNHRIHNYFLFFLKNILISDFSKVEDHNNIVLLFQKYLEIKDIFIEKWNDVTKKTALFDNAELLEVFINITKLNFFETKLDDKWLLILLDPAKITNSNYKILSDNLNLLLDFHIKYQYLLENSSNRKDSILTESYQKNSQDLKEYFLALNDYNQYLLQYDTAVITPEFITSKEEGLQLTTAVEFLQQFIWVSSLDTIVEIRDYWYCIQPILANDVPITNSKNGYCFKIENLIISWFNFSFILNSNESNTISNLSYINTQWEKFNISTNYVMDIIKEDLSRKFLSVQDKEKDKYDFTRFFINTFINIQDLETIDTAIEDINNPNEFIAPISDSDTLQVRKLKQALLWENSYLKKIRDFLAITYDHLITTRVDDIYIVNIFPVDFNLTVTDWFLNNKFKWKFSWQYLYWSQDKDNIFKNISLLLIDPLVRDSYSFLLNKTSININWEILTKDIQELITKILFPYNKIEKIYYNLFEKFPNQNISLNYQLDTNQMNFELSNNYTIIYDMESQVEIYENNNKLISISYDRLLNYLDTLP